MWQVNYCDGSYANPNSLDTWTTPYGDCGHYNDGFFNVDFYMLGDLTAMDNLSGALLFGTGVGNALMYLDEDYRGTVAATYFALYDGMGTLRGAGADNIVLFPLAYSGIVAPAPDNTWAIGPFLSLYTYDPDPAFHVLIFCPPDHG